MGFLHILSWTGAGAGSLLVVVSLAAGLYYLAELIEEYTVATKRILKWASGFVALSHILLCIFDGFPLKQTLFSLLTLAWSSLMLKNFPVIELVSPIFIGSCILTISNHFSWFFFFTRHAYSLPEIGAFFGLLVWAVPFTYFISLSASEFTLPSYVASPTAGNMSLDQSSSSGGDSKQTLKRTSNYVKSFVMGIVNEVRAHLPTVSSPASSSKRF